MELTEDAAYNQAQAERMKETFEIPWEVTARTGALDRFWDVAPELAGDEIPELPVLILLRADRKVHAIHACFLGPESGSAYEAFTKALEQEVASLVAH